MSHQCACFDTATRCNYAAHVAWLHAYAAASIIVHLSSQLVLCSGGSQPVLQDNQVYHQLAPGAEHKLTNMQQAAAMQI